MVRHHVATPARLAVATGARLAVATGALALLGLLTSCATVPGTPVAGSTPAGSTPAGTSPTATTDHDLGQGLAWTGPADAQVQRFASGGTGCGSADASVPTAGGSVRLMLLPADCPQSDQQPLNANHGQYLVPPAFAGHLARPGTVPTGSLVTFTQTYSEYTNSRTDFTDTVGLVTLSDGGRFAVLMLLRTGKAGDLDDIAPDEITAIACAIHRTGRSGGGTACG